MAVKLLDKKDWTKDGRKWIFYDYVKNLDGTRRKYKSKKFFTKTEALKAERDFLTINADRSDKNRNMTFRDLYTLFYAYKEDGLFQSEAEIKSYTNNKGELLQPNAKPGDIKFVDVNGDGVIDGNDRDYIGNPLPDVTAGLTLGVNFHNFDLSLFFQGMFGNDVYDLTRYVGDFYNQSQYNKNSRVVNAWTPTNTNTDIPRVTMDDPNNNIRPSSYYVQDASFVRLKNMKIGYSVPQSILSKIKFNSLYIYAQATNLFTITGYDGIDPEVGLQSYSSDYRNLDMGVDRGIYPLSRTFTFGVNVSF